ncbi:hypothetical protein [Halorussus lipolyticus]|uniref:hypothetical protein n=1 Tax=Halorussus lipolyticus TaxID=3034024 RepID=UPI0023E880C4|nr:hypothetical protein [Halorussus sp. DT80]
MTYSDGDLADWLNEVGEEDDRSDSVDGASTSPRRVERTDAPDLADPDALADELATADSRANALADELALAETGVRDGANASEDAHGEAAGAGGRVRAAGVLDRVRAAVGAQTDAAADGGAGTDARAEASADPLADSDADADARTDWRERADAHYAAARGYARTCWSAWVRAWAFVCMVAWALDPRTRFPAPPDADPPDWAFALAPYVRGFAAWARAELRPEALFARWLGWVEDRQNRLLAASGFAGTVVSLVLAAVGQWPLGGLLGALVLWVLVVLYVPAGVALALKQYRGEFDRGWFDLPDHSRSDR